MNLFIVDIRITIHWINTTRWNKKKDTRCLRGSHRLPTWPSHPSSSERLRHCCICPAAFVAKRKKGECGVRIFGTDTPLMGWLYPAKVPCHTKILASSLVLSAVGRPSFKALLQPIRTLRALVYVLSQAWMPCVLGA